MARTPFSQQQYTLEGAGSNRTLEENTGAREGWKPVNGNRTNEVGGWGGKGYRYEEDPTNGGLYAVPGSRISDEDVERYRQLGAAHRSAVELDRNVADRAVGAQFGSLARLSAAAAGRAPSRAAALGQIANEDAVRAGRVTGRGPMGSLRATRGAMAGQSAQAGAAAAQVGDMRAQEMARARGDYFGGAHGMRRQDIGESVTNAQLEAANRDLEQRRQLGYEQLGWDTRNAELFGMVEQRGQEDDAWLKDQQLKHEESENDRQKVEDFTSAGTGMFTGALGSDPRMKHRITYGSLAGIGMKGRR